LRRLDRRGGCALRRLDRGSGLLALNVRVVVICLICGGRLIHNRLGTTSDFAELVLAMLGVAVKLERRRIAERTARGRADAKAKVVKFGRKPTLTPHQQQEARERLATGETQRSGARSYNVSQATISRLTA
jgi:DNA invertase Pin-like site-specific DNA recombinase